MVYQAADDVSALRCSRKETVEAEIPWDVYFAVTVLAVAVIGLWEAVKHCVRKQETRLRMLRNKANKVK